MANGNDAMTFYELENQKNEMPRRPRKALAKTLRFFGFPTQEIL